MIKYEKRMAFYDDNMDEILPTLDDANNNEQRCVLITHDESIFYCNNEEKKKIGWKIK